MAAADNLGTATGVSGPARSDRAKAGKIRTASILRSILGSSQRNLTLSFVEYKIQEVHVLCDSSKLGNARSPGKSKGKANLALSGTHFSLKTQGLNVHYGLGAFVFAYGIAGRRYLISTTRTTSPWWPRFPASVGFRESHPGHAILWRTALAQFSDLFHLRDRERDPERRTTQARPFLSLRAAAAAFTKPPQGSSRPGPMIM